MPMLFVVLLLGYCHNITLKSAGNDVFWSNNHNQCIELLSANNDRCNFIALGYSFFVICPS